MSDPHQCPICKGPFEGKPSSFPFCSERCKLLDLSNWISGRYVVSRPITEEEWELLDKNGTSTTDLNSEDES